MILPSIIIVSGILTGFKPTFHLSLTVLLHYRT